MEKNILLGRQLGYIKCSDENFISPEIANTLRPDEILKGQNLISKEKSYLSF